MSGSQSGARQTDFDEITYAARSRLLQSAANWQLPLAQTRLERFPVAMHDRVRFRAAPLSKKPRKPGGLAPVYTYRNFHSSREPAWWNVSPALPW